jgi:hypothetical protein
MIGLSLSLRETGLLVGSGALLVALALGPYSGIWLLVGLKLGALGVVGRYDDDDVLEDDEEDDD